MSNDQTPKAEMTKVSLGMEVLYQSGQQDSKALAHHISDNANTWLTSIEDRTPGEADLAGYTAMTIANPESYRELLEEHFQAYFENPENREDPAKLAKMITQSGLMSVPEFIHFHLHNATIDQVIHQDSQMEGSPPDQ